MTRAAAFALTLSFASTALANGAFPDGLHAFFHPSRPGHLSVATTFGLATTDDAGAHWRYACERLATAAQDVVMYQQAVDGTLFAVAASGLFRTNDGGCSWTRAQGFGDKGVADASVDPDDPAHVLAISFDAQYRSALFESRDGGRSFEAVYSSATDVLLSVELAKGGGRVYMTTWRRGETSSSGWLLSAAAPAGPWSETKVADEPAPGVFPRITAVDPRDREVVYLRMQPAPGTGEGEALGASADGGRTVTTLLSLAGQMGGFALGPDDTLYVGARAGTLHRRAPGAGSFTATAGPNFRCLVARPDALYACGDSRTDRYALARSTDLGVTFQPVLALRDIEGPLACVAAACADDWDALRPTLLTVPYPDTPDAGAPLDAGTAAVDAGSPPVKAPPEPAGCGCATSGFGWTTALAIALRRRVNRYRTRPPTPSRARASHAP